MAARLCSFNNTGMKKHWASFTTRFNPLINSGQQVKVKSDLTPQVDGFWEIRAMTHNLDAETPKGLWQTRFEAISFAKRATPQFRTQGP